MIFLEDSTKAWRSTETIDLVWTDPPFGTGKVQTQGGNSFQDLTPIQAADVAISAIQTLTPYLSPDATICICMDYRTIHRTCVRMENLGFTLRGEVIWEFGLGRPRTSWWPNRHNTIATFTLDDRGLFDPTAIPRVPRQAPKPGYPEDRNAGSVWNKTLSNTDPERVGYPNQKPLDIIRPFIQAHTLPGDHVVDPFMGSGAVGVAAVQLGRRFTGQDVNPQSFEVCAKQAGLAG